MPFVSMRGDYHYHALLVSCLVRDADPSEPDPVMGFSFDGFPIHGPRGCLDAACEELVTFCSGWQQTGDPSTYAWDNNAYAASDDPTVLDRCNGRFGPDGTYRYHATETFPYILGCHHRVALAQEGTGAGTGTGAGGTGTGTGACATDADCAGDCPAGSYGCGCRTNREGARACVPTCRTTADCPSGLTCGGREGDVCVPGAPPQ